MRRRELRFASGPSLGAVLAPVSVNLYDIRMFHVQNSVANEDEIDTILDADIEFSGSLESERTLLIKGKITGTIVCADSLFISDQAVVDADIRAPRVTVRGMLKGSVKASETIQILAGSSVEAALEAPDIIIEDKEHFSGTMTITGEPEDGELPDND
jgi:cytoskeletal protein CcmA (bactofilin family)